MRYISLYFFRCLIFLFWFSIPVDSYSGSPRSSPFVPLLLSDTGVSTSLFSRLDDIDSCEEDDEEVDEDVGEEELADNPGTTNGTKFDVLR